MKKTPKLGAHPRWRNNGSVPPRALDKGDGSVRPIGVGEVFRRIMAKCVIQITKPDILDVTGSLQVSAGQEAGVKQQYML